MGADSELLASYVRDRSQEAFSELVARHVDVVYASARRQLGNEALAQDVTQALPHIDMHIALAYNPQSTSDLVPLFVAVVREVVEKHREPKRMRLASL